MSEASEIDKEISRITRIFLEIAVESFKAFNTMKESLAQGRNKGPGFLGAADGYLKWLKDVTEFGKSMKKHLQKGRMSLSNDLGEQLLFDKLKILHSVKYEKKSALISELNQTMRAVFEIKGEMNDELINLNPTLSERCI
jgi:hypothetical protein